LSSADKREEVLQILTPALYDVNNIAFFEIYGVSARTRWEGAEPLRTFVDKGDGSIFRDFVRTSFMELYNICEALQY